MKTTQKAELLLKNAAVALKKLSKKKHFWIYAFVLASGIGVGVWALFFRKKKVATLASLTKSAIVVKALPDYTMLAQDLLEGFDDSQFSEVDGVISAPYIEKQIDFAAKEGLDVILIAVPIDHVYRKGDGKADFTVVEHCFNYAAKSGLFIVSKLRMEPFKSYLYEGFNVADFTANKDSVKFSSNFWSTHARKFAADYKARFTEWHNDNRILCVFPTSTEHQEWGYAYDLPLFETGYGERVRNTVRVMHELADELSPLRVGVDSGCFYDNEAANFRGTPALKDLTDRPNILVVKDNPAISYDLAFDHALLLSVIKPKGGFAFVEHTNSPSGKVTAELKEDFKFSIDTGMDIAGFAFTYDEAGFAVVREVIADLKVSGHYRRTKTAWAPVGEVRYTTTELKNNGGYNGAILNRLKASMNANGGKLPTVSVTNDL